MIISLITDFGLQDSYVGVMKGVIATLSPTAQLIDLTHSIPPQDIYSARFALLSAYPYLPPGTICLVVVDPGVGTTRRAVAVQTSHGFLVGPDNGVLSGVLDSTPAIVAVELLNPDYWRSPQPSVTFTTWKVSPKVCLWSKVFEFKQASAPPRPRQRIAPGRSRL
jgi:S-adenosylmethionine hydrolase